MEIFSICPFDRKVKSEIRFEKVYLHIYFLKYNLLRRGEFRNLGL